MSEISQLQINGHTYNLVDATARDNISQINNTIGHCAMVGGVSTNTTLTTSNTYVTIPFSNLIQTLGSESLFSSDTTTHGIHISTTGWFLVSGSLSVGTGFADNDIIHFSICRNSADEIAKIQTRVRSTSPWLVLTISPVLIYSDSADWNVWARAMNEQAARGNVNAYNSGVNRLVIMKVK